MCTVHVCVLHECMLYGMKCKPVFTYMCMYIRVYNIMCMHNHYVHTYIIIIKYSVNNILYCVF